MHHGSQIWLSINSTDSGEFDRVKRPLNWVRASSWTMLFYHSQAFHVRMIITLRHVRKMPPRQNFLMGSFTISKFHQPIKQAVELSMSIVKMTSRQWQKHQHKPWNNVHYIKCFIIFLLSGSTPLSCVNYWRNPSPTKIIGASTKTHYPNQAQLYPTHHHYHHRHHHQSLVLKAYFSIPIYLEL